MWAFLQRWFGADPELEGRVRRAVGDGATVVDVRSPAEYAGGHAEGAINVPVGDIGARLTEIPREKPVVVYCASGIRSARAARTLRDAGYADVIDARTRRMLPP
jgi:phage shock protein E